MILGQPVADLRTTVRLLSRGPVSCTHLNDLFRSLADVPVLEATPEIRVDCPDATKFEVVERVREHFRAIAPVVEIDGARVSFENGWGLVRASNTQPALVMRVEADSAKNLADYRSRMEDAIADARRIVEGG